MALKIAKWRVNRLAFFVFTQKMRKFWIMRKYIWLPFLLLTINAGVFAQSGRLPKFSDYPATVEKARVKGVTFGENPSARAFGTRLTYAFDRGVNFAGHYILTGWGCGTGCTNAAIIEARTGDIIWPNQFANIDATYGDRYSDEQIEFRKNSRLLIIHGRPGSMKEFKKVPPSGDHYFEWKNNRLRILKVVEKQTN